MRGSNRVTIRGWLTEAIHGRLPAWERRLQNSLPRRSLAQFTFFLSLFTIFPYLLLARPSAPFYALALVPIALAALLHEFLGGTLVALASTAVVALLAALDPNAQRRAVILREVWPILISYLAVGPIAGWLAARERERERQLVSAARRLHVVQEIAQAITTSLDLDETLQTIFNETHRLIPFQSSAVILREKESLRVVAARNRPEIVGYHFPIKGTAAGRVIEHNRIWLGGPGDIARFQDIRQICRLDADCVLIPLQVHRIAVGVFILGGRGLASISAADLDNLTQIAGQMAVAIKHAQLFAAERQWSQQLAAIGESVREITVSHDLERTLSLVMTKAVETLPMDAGALFQFDQEAQAYRVAVSHNLSPDHVEQIIFEFEEGVPGWVVNHRQPLILDDAAVDPRVHPNILEDGVQSVMAIPLEVRQQVVGVLTLYCKTNTHAFGGAALKLARVYADQAAVFIENARLVDELRLAAAELEARVERRTRQLKQKQAQVIRAEKMAVVGRLAASVAHEVNNPLQAIALHLQLLTDVRQPGPARDQLAVVQQELDRIAGIVQRLLEFQKPKHGRRSLQSITTLLEEVLALAGKQIQQADVNVVYEPGQNLALIDVVGDQLKQVFLNLVLNAVEAMPGGGHLRIKTEQANGRLRIHISDSGIGMTPEVMTQLFEPFFSTKHTGTGLGLAVSHEIITQYGGTLTAVSHPGAGATFTISLPLDSAS